MTDLPEGAIENARVEVVQFIAKDGQIDVKVHCEGEVPLSQILGLLQVASMRIHDAARSEW